MSVESAGWLDALALALPQFKLSAGRLDRFVCAMNPDGSVEVHEPVANVRLRVVPTQEHAAADMPWSSHLLAEPDDHAAPPPVAAPLDDRVVALFDRCSEISAASDARAACTIALNIVREFVPANAGAVIMTTPDGARLEFISAFGPQSQKVVGSTLPLNHGIVGFIRDFPVGVIVKDVHRDARFGGGVDRSSGYTTRSLLAVPVRTANGPTAGCLELLNSQDGFLPRDLETTATIASALGAWLGGSQN